MLDKTFLINKIITTLQKNEFEVFLTHGCFDIAAKREFLMLIKTLINIDGMNEDQALSLRAISHFVSAYPFVISLKNNRSFLNDNTVYSRFDLPVLTPKLFENIIVDEDMSAIKSAKGRHTAEINSSVLKEKRRELDYTLEELAKIIGISKKALYEIENNRVSPKNETAKKLENILGVHLRVPYEMRTSQAIYLKPKDEFQGKVSKELDRIGVDNSSVYSVPFQIIGKGKFSLITSLSKNISEVKREAVIVKRLSGILSSKVMFVAKKSGEKLIDGVPIIPESKLLEMSSSKELNEILEGS